MKMGGVFNELCFLCSAGVDIKKYEMRLGGKKILCLREMINTYKILVGNVTGGYNLGDTDAG
jgi:hypothetical protein